MGLIKKFSDLVRSNLNTWLSHAEDPQKLAELAILESQKNQQKAKNMLISAMGALNLADARLKALTLQLTELMTEAKAKLEKQDEQAAKQIIEEKQIVEQNIALADQEKSLHQQTIRTIHRGLTALEHQISSLKTKAAFSSDHVHNTEAFDTFDRMEQKIEASEAESQALAELLELTDKFEAAAEKLPAPSISKPIKVLSLEEELEELKKKL